MTYLHLTTSRLARRWRCAALSVGVLALSPATAFATTYTVTSTSDSASGSCSAGVCTSLRAAVAAANDANNPDTTIQLGAGTFTLGDGPGSPVSTGELQIYSPITITGAGAGATVIEQTDGEDRVFDIWNGSATTSINDLTITGGTLPSGASEPGPAILALAPLSLDGVTISGNQETGSDTEPTSDGCCQAVGAIASLSSVTIDDSTITDNHAVADAGTNGSTGTDGGQAVGALLATKSSQITITNSTISNNTAVSGDGGSSTTTTGGAGGAAYGAIFVIDDAPLTITGTTFAGNTATAGAGGSGTAGGAGGSAYGGAVMIPDGTLEISDSTFYENTIAGAHGGTGDLGPGGAGGIAEGGAVTGGNRAGANSVLNTTFDANSATGAVGGSGLTGTGTTGYSLGGGLAEDVTQSITVVSSTFDANVAAGLGYGGNLYDNPTQLTLAEDIFAGGVAAGGSNCSIYDAATETDDGHNLESTSGQCGLSAAKDDQVDADPELQPLAANGGPVDTMALGSGSAALAAGGTCIDYTEATGPLLATDARGEPRPVPCDIGAYQTGDLSLLPIGLGSDSGTVGSGTSGSGTSDSGTSGSGTSGSGTSGSGTSGSGTSGSGTSASGASGKTGGSGTGKTSTAGDTKPTTSKHASSDDPGPPTDLAITAFTLHARGATFRFSSTGATGYQCELIGPTALGRAKPRFTACHSPTAYLHLKLGRYTFRVRGIDHAGTTKTSADKSFRIR